MDRPSVGPLRVVPPPVSGWAARRRHPTWLRLTALLVLWAFVLVSVGTTAYSLGAYCLTTWGGSPFGRR